MPLASGDFEIARAASGLPSDWRPLYLNDAFRYRPATEASGNHYLELPGQGAVPYGNNPAAGYTVVFSGIKLYYETYGRGEPLLLHGNGQIPELAKHYQVIAVDTCAQGKSTSGKPTLTYDAICRGHGACSTPCASRPCTWGWQSAKSKRASRIRHVGS